MPEVAEEPGAYAKILELPEPVDFSRYTREEIVKALPVIEAEIAMGKSDEEKARIGMALDAIFGPFRLTAFHTKETEKRVRLARVQHTAAHHILYAMADKANSSYVRRMLKVTSTMYQISRAYSYQEELKDVPQFWAGTKAEVALINTLLNGDYTVVVPDYRQTSNEVLEWDINPQIQTDFFVVDADNKNVFLVDVKSRSQLSVPFDVLAKSKRTAALPVSLTGAINKRVGIPPSQLNHLTVFLSTKTAYWEIPQLHPLSTNPSETLASYISLRSGIQSGILGEFGRFKK